MQIVSREQYLKFLASQGGGIEEVAQNRTVVGVI
jgi:hypothetical protein